MFRLHFEILSVRYDSLLRKLCLLCLPRCRLRQKALLHTFWLSNLRKELCRSYPRILYPRILLRFELRRRIRYTSPQIRNPASRDRAVRACRLLPHILRSRRRRGCLTLPCMQLRPCLRTPTNLGYRNTLPIPCLCRTYSKQA